MQKGHTGQVHKIAIGRNLCVEELFCKGSWEDRVVSG